LTAMGANSVIKRALTAVLGFTVVLVASAPAATASVTVRTRLDGPLQAARARTGYWLVTRDGGVASGGGAPDLGGLARSVRLDGPVVGMSASPDGKGYWLASSSGAVYSFGDAKFYGSRTPAGALGEPGQVVGIAATSDGRGYWLASSNGGVYSFGDAHFFGSLKGGVGIVAIAAVPGGGGYWLVSASGRVFCFGDATYHGSAPALGEVVGFAATSDAKGYFLATANGSVLSFGDARSFGSAEGAGLLSSFIGIAAGHADDGYWVANSQGTTYGFGAALATSASNLARGAVAIVADPAAVMVRPAVAASPGVPLRGLRDGTVLLPGQSGGLAVQFALAQVGKPYIWGGTGPYGYDCSGLALASWAAAGVLLPRTAAGQYWAGTHVPISQVEPGDLIFWASDPSDPATIYHVAISLGGTSTVQATHSGSYVQVMNLWPDGLVPLATAP